MLKEQTERDLGIRDFVYLNIIELDSCYNKGGETAQKT